MNLIELLVYVSILSTFLVGGIFSAYSFYISESRENDGVIEETSRNSVIVDFSTRDYTNGGFVALFASVCIALGIFMMAISLSQNYANLYETVMKAEYRLVARERAEACLSIAQLYLSEDYFFTKNASSTLSGRISRYEKDMECEIERIDDAKIVVSAGFNSVGVRIESEFKFVENSVKVTSKKFILI